MQRVLVIIPSLSAAAGAEQSAAAVLPHIMAEGVEVHLAVLSTDVALLPGLINAGATFHDLSGLSFPRRVRAIRRLAKDLRPDLVHATLFQAELPSHLALLGTRVPLLVTWASTPVDASSEPVASWKLHAVRVAQVALAHLPHVRFHAVTDGVAAAQCRSLGVRRARVRVAERGRNADEYPLALPQDREAARRRLGLPAAATVFLNVGRQEPPKGHVDLIRTFDSVAGELPSAVLLIAGREGRSSAEVSAAHAASSHSDRIHLLGHRDDIADLLRAADAIVCSSYREGAAGALIEAMAVGTPIVSVRLDGLEGILEDGVNSRYVARLDLAAALVDVANDPDGAATRALRARELFEERFTVRGSALRLLDVYRWASRRTHRAVAASDNSSPTER